MTERYGVERGKDEPRQGTTGRDASLVQYSLLLILFVYDVQRSVSPRGADRVALALRAALPTASRSDMSEKGCGQKAKAGWTQPAPYSHRLHHHHPRRAAVARRPWGGESEAIVRSRSETMNGAVSVLRVSSSLILFSYVTFMSRRPRRWNRREWA